MANSTPIYSRGVKLRPDRVPNATGLLLCLGIAVPIWAGILALVF